MNNKKHIIMKTKKLKFKKEIVANLSDAESKQKKGGTTLIACFTGETCDGGQACFWTYQGSCFCGGQTQHPNSTCCGPTYADCTLMTCGSNNCK